MAWLVSLEVGAWPRVNEKNLNSFVDRGAKMAKRAHRACHAHHADQAHQAQQEAQDLQDTQELELLLQEYRCYCRKLQEWCLLCRNTTEVK